MCPASEDGRRLDVICLFSSIGDLLEGVSLLLVSQFSAAWLASEAVDSDSAALKLLRQSEPGLEQKRSDLTTCKLQHDMGRLHVGEPLPLGARRQDEATIRLASQKGLTLHTSLPTPSAACSAKPSSTPSTSTTPPSSPCPATNTNKPSAAELLPRVRVSMTWRRGGDSNPRCARRTAVFKTATFGRSVTSPGRALGARQAQTLPSRWARSHREPTSRRRRGRTLSPASGG